uniref:Uncharacterized protein n=1 Tax=Knipowitschia caucasica TaxID=637954 RepID=A0AAV2JKY7_KNICA
MCSGLRDSTARVAYGQQNQAEGEAWWWWWWWSRGEVEPSQYPLYGYIHGAGIAATGRVHLKSLCAGDFQCWNAPAGWAVVLGGDGGGSEQGGL